MKKGAMVNAMRSGVVVIGALAFGYLSLELGFKPFLERAQQQQQQQLEQESIIQQHRQVAAEDGDEASQSFS